jgi:hypothetical protein
LGGSGNDAIGRCVFYRNDIVCRCDGCKGVVVVARGVVRRGPAGLDQVIVEIDVYAWIIRGEVEKPVVGVAIIDDVAEVIEDLQGMGCFSTRVVIQQEGIKIQGVIGACQQLIEEAVGSGFFEFGRIGSGFDGAIARGEGPRGDPGGLGDEGVVEVDVGSGGIGCAVNKGKVADGAYGGRGAGL